MTAAGYLRWMFLALAAFSAGVLVLTLVADPFGIYRPEGGKRPGLVMEQPRMTKPYFAGQVLLGAVLLGSSRSEQAMDAGHRLLGGEGYNLAVPGGLIYEMLRHLQHAASLRPPHPLHLAVMELSPFHFDARTARQQTGFSESRLACTVDGTRRPLWFLADLPETAWSLEAMEGARKTLLPGTHRVASISELYPLGRINPVFLNIPSGRDGSPLPARQVFLANVRPFMAETYPGFTLVDAAGRSPAFDHLAAMVDFCRSRRIRLVLFFSPEHAYLAWAAQACGIREQVETAKRRVVALAGNGVEVWDFSRMCATTTQPIPVDGLMADYLEAGHFRKRLGDRILDTIADGQAQDGFGIRLEPGMLEDELRAQRAGLFGWAESHPEERTEVESLRPHAP
jgi:hypothetical protein